MKNNHYGVLLFGFMFSFLYSCNLKQDAVESGTSGKEPYNVLFIAVDDLRPELGCYGKPHVQSPNIDKLASSSLVFDRAYCSVPVCGASRASLMTGMRPTRDRFVTYYSRADEDVPEAISLPKLFKQNGYQTAAFGKIYHMYKDDSTAWHSNYHPHAVAQQNWRDYQSEENRHITFSGDPKMAGPAFEISNIHDSVYYDGKTARRAVEKLEELAVGEQPFFLAVGFIRPHLPFNAPKKYWDLYDSADFEVPYNYYFPESAPKAAWHQYELRGYTNIPTEKEEPVLDSALARRLIHGYKSAVSYTDAQVGLVLDKLKETGADKNTIVILWGDHGWSLGEHAMWCKHSNFHIAMNAPMILHHPDYAMSQRSQSLVEFIDIYPTLAELAGLDVPATVDGKSFAHLLQNPQTEHKSHAFIRYKAENEAESVVTNTFSYTEWKNEQDSIVGRMLFNLKEDPDEMNNIVDNNLVLADSLQKLLSWK